MLSPVWTPMGSIFSIEQMMTQLSLRSRTTSISYSFQPSTDSSTSTCLTGEACSPARTICSYSSLLYAMPPPVPASVKEGRMMSGRPILARACSASAMLVTISLFGQERPRRSMHSRKSLRSSAIAMALRLAPISSIFRRSSVPLSASSIAVFSAVCPPMVGRRASGRSFSRILATMSGRIGSI